MDLQPRSERDHRTQSKHDVLAGRIRAHQDTEEEIAAGRQWAENSVSQFLKDAGAAEIPIEWVSKEAFFATEVLANVL